MTTTVVTPIGTGQSGGLGAGAATPQAWINLINGLNLVGADQIQQGQLLNQEFTAAGFVLDTAGLSWVTDATHYLDLTTAASASFRDQSGVRTNPLFYDATKGASIRTTVSGANVFNIQGGTIHISNIEFSGGINIGSIAVVTLNNLIVASSADGEPLGIDVGCALTINNCLIYNTSPSPFSRGFSMLGNTLTINDTTIVAPAGVTASHAIDYGDSVVTANLTGVAIFGYTTDLATRAGSATISYGHCATDLGVPTGTGNLGSLTYANQFTSTTNDFSTKSGAGLINAGVVIGGITTDISAFTRSGTPTIGAWEFGAGSGSPAGGGLLLFGGSIMCGWTPAPLLGAAALWKAGQAVRRNATLSRRMLIGKK